MCAEYVPWTSHWTGCQDSKTEQEPVTAVGTSWGLHLGTETSPFELLGSTCWKCEHVSVEVAVYWSLSPGHTIIILWVFFVLACLRLHKQPIEILRCESWAARYGFTTLFCLLTLGMMRAFVLHGYFVLLGSCWHAYCESYVCLRFSFISHFSFCSCDIFACFHPWHMFHLSLLCLLPLKIILALSQRSPGG